MIITSYMCIGGCDEFQNYYNDIHLFDINNSTWIQPQIEESVPARYMHSASVYNNKLFIYGGFAKNPECKKREREGEIGYVYCVYLTA